MGIKDILQGIGDAAEELSSISSGWTDQTTCPDCGGTLFTRWDSYLECEDCHEQFAVGEDGVLFTEYYNDPNDD